MPSQPVFYGRFSRPRAYLRFSDIAVVAPFQESSALMFRLAPFKNNALTDADVIVSAAIEVIENGTAKSNFYRLDTQLSKINTLALNWTVVHPINENSPFSDSLRMILKIRISRLSFRCGPLMKSFRIP